MRDEKTYHKHRFKALEPFERMREKEVKSTPKWRFDYRFSRILSIVFPAIYASILFVFSLVYKVSPGPEFIVLCFFIYAAYNKWSRRFVKDWIPFVTFFLSYEAMFGLVGTMAGIVHVQEPINVELQTFGTIPTLLLQQFYRTPVLDYLGALFYSLHFIAPTFFGFMLWKYRSKDFWKYTLALAISTYSALITFLVYPVAPPWFGVNATRVLFQVDHSLGMPIYRTIFDYLQPNPFAAFPSLHATYPWLISLYTFKIRKAKAWPILVFPLGVWFSAVYLGEHYVVDVIGGAAYATFAFLLVEKLTPRLFHGNVPTNPEPPLPIHLVASVFGHICKWSGRLKGIMMRERLLEPNIVLEDPCSASSGGTTFRRYPTWWQALPGRCLGIE